MKMQYNTNYHSVFLLQYHLIFVVKYRRKVISDEICKSLKEVFENIAKKPRYAIKIIEFNHDIDHLHILLKVSLKAI